MIRRLFSLSLSFSRAAVDESANLTDPCGVLMTEVPLHPCLARALLKAAEKGCAEELATIAGMLGVQSIWQAGRVTGFRALDAAKRRFAVAEGDLVSYLNVWDGWNKSNRSAKWCAENCVNHKAMLRVSDIRNQLCAHLRRRKIPVLSSLEHRKDSGGTAGITQVMKCVVEGYFMNAAVLITEGGSGLQDEYGAGYRLVRARARVGVEEEPPVLRIHPGSVLFRCKPEWVVFTSVQQSSNEVLEMQDVTAVQPEWLTEIAPHYFQTVKINTEVPDPGERVVRR